MKEGRKPKHPEKTPDDELQKSIHRDTRQYRTIGGPNAAQSGNQGEGRDQEDDQAEDGKMT